MPKLSSVLQESPEQLIVRSDAERIAHVLGGVAMFALAPLLYLGNLLHRTPFAASGLFLAALLVLTGLACRRYRDRLVLDRHSSTMTYIRSLRLLGRHVIRPQDRRLGFAEIEHISHLTRAEPRYSGVFVLPTQGPGIETPLPADAGFASTVAEALGRLTGAPVRNAAAGATEAGPGTVISREALTAITRRSEALNAPAADGESVFEVPAITLWARLPRHIDLLLALIPLAAFAAGAWLVAATKPSLPPPVALIAGVIGIVTWGFVRHRQVRRLHRGERLRSLRIDADGIELPSLITADGQREYIARERIARIEAQWSYARRTRSDRNQRAMDMGSVVLHLRDGSRRVLSLWHLPPPQVLEALQHAGYTVTQAAGPTSVLATFRWAMVAACGVMLTVGMWKLWPQLRWALGAG